MNTTSAEAETRWKARARLALQGWGLDARRIRTLEIGAKAVFRVDSDRGVFVLRLQDAGQTNEARLRAELSWLRAIRAETDLLAPLPVPANNADSARLYRVLYDQDCAPRAKIYAALYEFIDGEIKSASELTAADVARVGAYLARLHRDAQLLPPGLDLPRLDEDGFFAAGSPYAPGDEPSLLNEWQGETMRAAESQVRGAMARLTAEGAGFGLIHADLLAKNIVFRADRVAAIDFEFCAWGYFLYDLAPLLWQLRGERAGDYADLEAALWTGYRSILPGAARQPDTLEALIAARQLASCRWLLANLAKPGVRAAVPKLLAQRCGELRDYLATGLLRRRSATL